MEQKHFVKPWKNSLRNNIMDQTLSKYLRMERKLYLESCGESGGTAEGFRVHIRDLSIKEPKKFEVWKLDALMEATTKTWETQPRKHGDDLFSIAGIIIPEHLTRPSRNYETGADAENEFEKVDSEFATVNDLREDAILHMRIAAQTAAAAEQQMETADEALKRAKGNLRKRLKDIAD